MEMCISEQEMIWEKPLLFSGLQLRHAQTAPRSCRNILYVVQQMTNVDHMFYRANLSILTIRHLALVLACLHDENIDDQKLFTLIIPHGWFPPYSSSSPSSSSWKRGGAAKNCAIRVENSSGSLILICLTKYRQTAFWKHWKLPPEIRIALLIGCSFHFF